MPCSVQNSNNACQYWVNNYTATGVDQWPGEGGAYGCLSPLGPIMNFEAAPNAITDPDWVTGNFSQIITQSASLGYLNLSTTLPPPLPADPAGWVLPGM
jgi:hypothetical protein